MSMSWWSLGEDMGQMGTELSDWQITCAFCGESGNWKIDHHAEMKRGSDQKRLNFDTLKCGSCAGYVMVLWSAGHGLHDFKVLPWPLKYNRHPEHWPSDIGRYWLQAKRNLTEENWDAAVVMAGSAMQLALRAKGAKGETLSQEVEDLSKKREFFHQSWWSGQTR